jgi:hypothetical protein
VEFKLNDQQQLYVIPSGGGYSCLGYENARRDTQHIAAVLGRTDLVPVASDFGARAGYAKYLAACSAWASSAHSKKTWFTPGTPNEVQQILERYRQSARVLRLFLGDRATGRDWMEENDVVGKIGRSGGSQKVPLLIEPGADGGAAILTDCIVRLMDADGRELYRHESYQEPALSLEMEQDKVMRRKGYTWAVRRDGKPQARFRDVYSGAEYVEFMTGRIATRRHDLVQHLRAA